MDKFQKDTQYLVVMQNFSIQVTPILIEIIDVTDQCYRVIRQNGYKSWEMKKSFDSDWNIVEQLTEKRPMHE